MLLQLSQFFPLFSLLPGNPIPSSNLPLSSCSWVMHISSLATPFPILFLTPPCLFCTCPFVLLNPCTLREKQIVTSKGVPIKLSADFSKETLQTRRDCQKGSKVIKTKDLDYSIQLSYHLQLKGR